MDYSLFYFLQWEYTKIFATLAVLYFFLSALTVFAQKKSNMAKVANILVDSQYKKVKQRYTHNRLVDFAETWSKCSPTEVLQAGVGLQKCIFRRQYCCSNTPQKEEKDFFGQNI